jgi:hypothetical protein
VANKEHTGNNGVHKKGDTAQTKRDDLSQQAERLKQAARMNRQPHNRTSEG